MLSQHDLAPSRCSWAVREPVEAPEGAQASPTAPDSSVTSALMVGLPRLSNTSKALISTIVLMRSFTPFIQEKISDSVSFSLDPRLRGDDVKTPGKDVQYRSERRVGKDSSGRGQP